MTDRLQQIADKCIEKIMEKITDEHPFWKSVRFLVAVVGGAWAIRFTLEALGQQAFTKDAGVYYALVLSWFGLCYWALPNICPSVNGKKLFWSGWVFFMVIALISMLWKMFFGTWEPILI